MKVSIVLPAYNEELAIGKVIDDIQSVMSQEKYEYEILVVDDNSSDRTPEIAKQKGVRVVHRTLVRSQHRDQWRGQLPGRD